MKRILLTLLFLCLASPALATTEVWLFYGAGFHAFSTGMNQIASKLARTNGIIVHGPYDYRDTQRAYNEIRAAPTDHKVRALRPDVLIIREILRSSDCSQAYGADDTQQPVTWPTSRKPTGSAG